MTDHNNPDDEVLRTITGEFNTTGSDFNADEHNTIESNSDASESSRDEDTDDELPTLEQLLASYRPIQASEC